MSYFELAILQKTFLCVQQDLPQGNPGNHLRKYFTM